MLRENANLRDSSAKVKALRRMHGGEGQAGSKNPLRPVRVRVRVRANHARHARAASSRGHRTMQSSTWSPSSSSSLSFSSMLSPSFFIAVAVRRSVSTLARSHLCRTRNRCRRRCYERDCGVGITTNCIVTRKLRDYSARVNHQETPHACTVAAREKTGKWSRGKGETDKSQRGREREPVQTTTVYTFRLQLVRP